MFENTTAIGIFSAIALGVAGNYVYDKFFKKPPLPPDTPPPPIPWNVPHSKNKFFTGRKTILESLRSELSTKGAVALSQTSVISGLGGIGKTQTAVEFAFQNRSRYSAVLWSKAQSTADLISGFAAIARELKLATFETDEQEAVEAALSWLNDNSGWLLILDNADEPQLVERFIPTAGKGHVLVTSRAHDFSCLGIAQPMELKKMLPHEAVDFLIERTGRKGLDSQEAHACRNICKELDYLPLALEQAGAYIHKQGISFKAYHEQHKKDGLKLLERLGPQTGQYPESVLTTWLMNFMQVEDASPASAEVLRLSAFLASEGVCLEIFSFEDEVEAANALTPLVDYSLISQERGAQDFDVHRLVQAVMRLELGDEQKAYATRAVEAMNAAFPDPSKFENWGQCDRLLPHAMACHEWVAQLAIETEGAGLLLNQAGYYLDKRGRYVEAELLYMKALEIREKAYGPEHPYVAISLNNLAIIYHSLGRYDQSERLHKQACKIRENALGPEHPDVAQSLNNLAELYRAQDRYGEAEPLYKRSMEIWREALGSEHPQMAIGLSNLAILYNSLGKDDDAEPLHRQAHEIREKSLGSEHPDVAQSLNNLASHNYYMGKYKEAEHMYKRSIKIMEKALGSEHPDVATGLENYAILLEATSRLTEASTLRARAAAIRAKHTA